ncbi:MAG: hypothetical protein E7409_04205 [Ruminococcaceae bacterium]|nr:hypothetical protein [Oscillospiraceae bacterium]
MKQILTIVLLLTLCVTPLSGFASDLPHTIWAPLDAYAAAMDAGDDAAMYEHGQKLLQIMEGEPDSQTKTEFLSGKLEQLSRCAERLGRYAEAIDLHRRYLPYGESMGWTDGVIYAKKKIYLLQSELNLYIKDADYYPQNFGAKFEPKRGVYFGSVYDNDSRILDFDHQKIAQYFPKQNSTWLLYLEFGENPRDAGRYNRYLTRAQEKGIAVEFAWNTYGTIDANANDAYIRDVIDFLSEYNIPVFLRFAAEMNIGPNGNDPAAYVSAFRTVADYAHTKPNIAMVWSPSDLSALDRNYADYYPGNEYVDWVGASMYVGRYFQGKRDHGTQTDPLNTYFSMDEFAHPLNRVRELISFMETNGIAKPVMISECGVSHYVRTESEEMTNWAIEQLRRLYGDLFLRYPQIKMINYFNVQMPSEPNAYELYTNPSLHAEYNRLVDDPYFLSSTNDTTPYGWRPFDGGTVGSSVEIAVVGYYPKTLSNTVRYSIDGVTQGELTVAPFVIRAQNLSEGNHTLTVQFCDHNGTAVVEKTIEFTVSRPIHVTVNGTEVSFPDQKPVMVEDRTLVPARGVFEQMGLSVGWIEETQTATITGGKAPIRLSIGDNRLYVGDEVRTMDVPAQIIGGRTMIPLRAVSDAAGAQIDWDGESYTAIINY